MFFKKKPRVPTSRLEAVKNRPPPSPPVQRRAVAQRAAREATFADCRVHYAGDACVAGVVLDHSDSGMRIRFKTKCALPNRVRIQSPKLGINRPAEVVRRQDFDIGVAFLPE
ncbi:MAG: PilZ domain-containing protein [Pseudomonadota bacterium]